MHKNHRTTLDFEEWLSLTNRIRRLRRLGRAALRQGEYKRAWEYYATVRRAEKRLRKLEDGR